jgi:hypothetical protein
VTTFHENAIRNKLRQAKEARENGDPYADTHVAMAAQVLEDLEQKHGKAQAKETLRRIKVTLHG